MKKIYKYRLTLIDRQYINMPIGYEILSVQVQDNDLVLWALVSPEMKNARVPIEINGTGNMIHEHEGESKKYLATIQMNYFVWHVFEIIIL